MLEEVFLLIARGVERHPDVIALCKGLSLPLRHTGFVEQRAEAGIVGIHEDDADLFENHLFPSGAPDVRWALGCRRALRRSALAGRWRLLAW